MFKNKETSVDTVEEVLVVGGAGGRYGGGGAGCQTHQSACSSVMLGGVVVDVELRWRRWRWWWRCGGSRWWWS
ncbi:hypothetical protein HanOQP8_Chr03g0087111 [Helianthus annuus]|nr:hypothetical protein HanOQP8_Chr03g0087111 [Helianthus annuus]